MTKPTPIQARVLRFLADNEVRGAHIVHLPRRRYDQVMVEDARGSWLRFEHIPPTTLEALKRLGYLACTRNELTLSGKVRESHYVLNEAGKAVLATLSPEDFVSRPGPRPALNETEITEALRQAYGDDNQGWAFFAQLRNATGYTYREQYIDGWALSLWPSRKITAVAFEIKVYASDLNRELKNPQKRAFAMSVSNEFYFVTPPGLASAAKIPEDCGLIEVSREGDRYLLKKVKRSPFRPLAAPTWGFVASVARQAARRSQG